MGSRSQHISIGIDRPAGEVYDFAADPLNLPKWAAGLAGARVEPDGAHWFTESPMGRVTITFAPRNAFGVLDHDVTLPSGETVYNPLRVIRDGDGARWSSPFANVLRWPMRTSHATPTPLQRISPR